MGHQLKEQFLVLAVDDPELLLSVRRFSVREGLSKLFSVRVIATHEDPNVDLEKIVGKPALFQISGGEKHTVYGARRWTGILENAEQIHADRMGESYYYFHLVPAFWLTTQRRETRIFQHKKIPEIIKEVLDEWGIESLNELNGTYKRHEYIVQYGETDYQFLCRLMEWAGITFYFKFQGTPNDGWDDPPHSRPPEPRRGESEKEQQKQKERAQRDQAKRSDPGSDGKRTGWTTVEPDDGQEPAAQGTGVLGRKAIEQKPLKLALSDGINENAPRPLSIHYVDQPSKAAQQEFLTQVRLTYNVAPGRFTIRDHDFRRNLDYPLFGKEKKGERPPEDFYEQYHYLPGDFAVQGQGGGTPIADSPYPYRHEQEAIGNARATRALQAARQHQQVVTFVTNCLDLGPGVVFTMERHPRADLSAARPLLVRGFNLEGYVNKEWTYEGDAVFADKVYMPELVTPKPRIRGVQSAIVAGEGQEEIYTDEHGRIKVQFHWDRDGQYNEKSSCWIRVNHEWAGTGFGTQLIPRVGQEVLVGFFEGDPDLPVVVGRVYNNITKVPYKLPTYKTRSTWKTDSTPESDGFSELMFEDEAQKELVFVQAETDLQKLVKQYETERVGQDHMTVVGRDRSAVISKLDATMVGERYLLQMIKPPNTTPDADGKPAQGDELSILPQKDPKVVPLETQIELKDKRVIFTTGEASLVLDDKNVRFEAAGSISVNAGGADCIIEGKKVHLNPGSPPPAVPKPDPFELPPTGIFSGHAADPRVELQRKLERDKLGAPKLDAPDTPDLAGPREVKQIPCELVASKVECSHGSGRQPCTNEQHKDFHLLQVVPDGAGEGAGNLSHKSYGVGDDPWWKLSSGDVIRLKSLFESNCAKHPKWLWSGPHAKGEKDAFDADFKIPPWVQNPKLAGLKLDSGKLKGAADSALEKVKDKYGKGPGKTKDVGISGEVKGLSWTAGAEPSGYSVQILTCSPKSHHYRIQSYPCDRLDLKISFDMTHFVSCFGWAKTLLEDLGKKLGLGTAELKCAISLEGLCHWKEHTDYRAFYYYEVSLSGDPFIGFELDYGISLLALFPATAAAAAVLKPFSKVIDPGSIHIKLVGEVAGGLKWSRTSPDTLKPTVSGEVKGTVTVDLYFQAFVGSKAIASVTVGGKTKLEMTLVPDPERTIIEPPMYKGELVWKPLIVHAQGGVLWWKKSATVEIFNEKKWDMGSHRVFSEGLTRMLGLEGR